MIEDIERFMPFFTILGFFVVLPLLIVFIDFIFNLIKPVKKGDK